MRSSTIEAAAALEEFKRLARLRGKLEVFVGDERGEPVPGTELRR